MDTLVSTIAKFIADAIAIGGYGGVALLMALESACLPIPSEIVRRFPAISPRPGASTCCWRLRPALSAATRDRPSPISRAPMAAVRSSKNGGATFSSRRTNWSAWKIILSGSVQQQPVCCPRSANASSFHFLPGGRRQNADVEIPAIHVCRHMALVFRAGRDGFRVRQGMGFEPRHAQSYTHARHLDPRPCRLGNRVAGLTPAPGDRQRLTRRGEMQILVVEAEIGERRHGLHF